MVGSHKSTPYTKASDEITAPETPILNQSIEKKKTRRVRLSHFKDGHDSLLEQGAGWGNLAAGAVYPVFLYLFGKMTDASMTDDKYKWFGYMFITAAADFGVAFLGCACAEVSAERQQRKMRLDFLSKVMEQEIGYFDAFDATTLSTKMGYNCVQVREAVGQKSANLIMYMGFVLCSLGFAFYKSWSMTLVSLTTVPFVIVAGLYTTYVDVKTTIKTKESFEEASSVAQEAFGAIKTVKAYSLEPLANQKFGDATDKTFETARIGGMKVGVATGFHWFFLFVSIVVAYIWGMHKLITAREDGCLVWGMDHPEGCFLAGDAIVTFWCIVGIGFFLSRTGPIFSARRKARVAIADIVDIYSRASQISPYTEEGVTKDTFRGHIEFKNVEFAYPTRRDRHVFRNLDLTIEAGKSTALVGSSGCGKSTVIQLIERFYDVDKGQLLIDGTDVRDYQVQWLRNQIALVSQEPRLFADTIHANIVVGKPSATRDEVIKAAKEANAHDFITKFPKGYDTHVGEGGGQLSGGQKQRIAIARAVLRDPKILILDEATSALDNESEKIVQETLNELVAKGQRTTIIIAHRLSTIRQADCIVVLDNPSSQGAILAEQGTHDELVRIPDGLYALLADAQTTTRNPEDEAALALNPEIGSVYSGEMSPRQASLIKLRSKFSSVRESSLIGLGDSYVKHPRTNVSRFQRRQYRRTVEPLKAHWIQLGLCMFGAICNGLVWPMFGLVWSYVVGLFIEPDAQTMRDKWPRWVAAWFGIAIVAFVGVFLQMSMVEHCGGIIVRAIRKRCFASILTQDAAFFDEPENSTGSLIALVSTDAIRLQKWGGENMAVYLQCLVAAALGLGLAMGADWRLGLVALASLFIVTPVTYLQSVLQRSGGLKNGKQQQQVAVVEDGIDETDEVYDTQQVLTETVLNIRTITAYNMQETMSRRYRNVVEREYLEGRRRAILSGLCWGLTQCVILFIITGNFYFGSWLIDNDPHGLDVRMMFQGLFCLILASMSIGKALTSATGNAHARNAAERVYYVIDHRPTINDLSPEGMKVPNFENMKFDSVKFHYPLRPDTQIYRSISFDVERGQSVALVGASGCGKSTCVQLLERFYDNTEGTIYLNGHDLQTYNVQSLRQSIGLVSQEPVLFYGTIEENIANGKPNCSIQQIQRAAKLANAHDFIMALPEGYETEVGRGGSKLSGGQKQRIAVARALIREPSLLILDEATSALDTESEKIVQEALNNLLATKQYTSLVIAHRLSTIRDCDKIVVFINPDGHGAKIAEVGTHAELLKKPRGIYRGLVNIADKRDGI